MTAKVPHYRPALDMADIVAGGSVRAQTWQDMANLTNFVQAYGYQSVPMWIGGHALDNGANTLRFKCRRSDNCIERVWVITTKGNTGTEVTAAVATDGGTSYSVTFLDGIDGGSSTPTNFGNGEPTLLIDSGAGSGTYAMEDVIVTITTSSASVELQSIGAFEYPKRGIAVSHTPAGVSQASLGVGQPITDAKIQSVFNASQDTNIGMNAGLFTAVSKTTGSIYSNATGTATDIFPTDPYICPRRVRYEDSTTTQTVWVYANGNGGTGQVNIGATTVVSGISTGGAAWYSGTYSSFNAEDLTQPSGWHLDTGQAYNFKGQNVTIHTLQVIDHL